MHSREPSPTQCTSVSQLHLTYLTLMAFSLLAMYHRSHSHGALTRFQKHGCLSLTRVLGLSPGSNEAVASVQRVSAQFEATPEYTNSTSSTFLHEAVSVSLET
jgi:hypothetical protein